MYKFMIDQLALEPEQTGQVLGGNPDVFVQVQGRDGDP